MMDIYKSFIDELVRVTEGVSERLIAKEGIYSKAESSEKFNKFVQSLSIEQRKLLADMLREERGDAIHDTLAQLTFLIDCEDVTLCHKGKTIETGYAGGMHQDYIGRLSGDWEWDKE